MIKNSTCNTKLALSLKTLISKCDAIFVQIFDKLWNSTLRNNLWTNETLKKNLILDTQQKRKFRLEIF